MNRTINHPPAAAKPAFDSHNDTSHATLRRQQSLGKLALSALALGCAGLTTTVQATCSNPNSGINYGTNSTACESGTAVGYGANALSNASAFGAGSYAFDYGSAFGTFSAAVGTNSVAIGSYSKANGNSSSAVGDTSLADGDNSSAYGTSSQALGTSSSAYGAGSIAGGNQSSAYGANSNAGGGFSSAFGNGSNASGGYSSAFGVSSTASGIGSSAFGRFSLASADNSVALGSASVANRTNTVSIGAAGSERQLVNLAAGTQATDAVNKGQLDAAISGINGNIANAVNYTDASQGSIALGGASGTAIHNLGAGVVASGSTDAVNGGQLYATNQTVQANTTAITQLDGRVTTIESSISHLQQTTVALDYVNVDGKGDGTDKATVVAGSRGVAVGSNAKAGGNHGTAVGGDSYAVGPNDTALGGNAKVNADGSTAVGANIVIAVAATNAVAMGESATVTAASGTAIGQGSSATAQGAVALGQGAVADQANTVSVGNTTQQRRVVNVAAGTAVTDAVNKGQLDQQTQSAIDQGKAYTDANGTATLNSAKAYANQLMNSTSQQFDQFRSQVNDRFNQVDTRMDRLGAMGAASTQMAINAAGASGIGRVAAGVGLQGGKAALSVGYAAPLSARTHVSFGATASGSEASAGIGFGVDL